MRRRNNATPGPYIHRILVNKDAATSTEAYPYNIPAVRDLDGLQLHPYVTFLVGENGTGKSTILEAIAVAYGFNAEGGSKDYVFHTRESHSVLSDRLTLVKTTACADDGFFLRAESFFTVATELENSRASRYGATSLHEQSHGESFLTLFCLRFGGNGLYILDEPEAALSPQRQLAFLRRLNDLVRAGCQFIIATHSPIILAYPNSTIWETTPEGIRQTTYTETDHYNVTKNFLDNPMGMLKVLFED